MTYEVRSLAVGETEVPGPEVFWMAAWDEWLPLTFQVALIRGPGVVALVNTGPPPDLTPIDEVWTAALGERARLRRSTEQELVPALDRLGIEPDAVTHVLLTPLQLYTVGNVTRFPRATICISRRGWIHFHTTHDHPHDERWLSIDRETLVHLVTGAWSRVRLLDDEDMIAPGLRTWWCGVHHRASMVVEVATAAGTVCITDAFFYFENFEERRPLGIGESLEEYERAAQRLSSGCDRLLPLYDPRVFDRYPDGIVA